MKKPWLLQYLLYVFEGRCCTSLMCIYLTVNINFKWIFTNVAVLKKSLFSIFNPLIDHKIIFSVRIIQSHRTRRHIGLFRSTINKPFSYKVVKKTNHSGQINGVKKAKLWYCMHIASWMLLKFWRVGMFVKWLLCGTTIIFSC